jgi:phage tail sheath protein FI
MRVDLPALTGAPSAPIANGATFTVQVHAPGLAMVPLTAKLEWTPSTAPTTTAALAMRVEEAIRKAAANDGKLSMVGATLRAENGKWFLRPGGGDYVAEMRVLAVAGDAVANALGLATSAGDDVRSNPQEYVLGTALSIGAQVAGVPGVDGSDLTGVQIVGEEGSKTGMYRLLDVDLFNILCIPAAADLAEASYVYDRAAALCVARRAFLIIDPPTTTVTLEQAKALPGIIERSPNAAVYFPRVEVLDPLNNFAPKSIGASGTMAGIFARTDAERGVWHAPAGVDAVLRGVHDLDVKLTDPENGVLNKLAVNCLRGFPVQGRIAWGARTLEGPDDNATEWKYVPIRRLALMIEESLYRGTKWAVFQPNDEPLWARLRQNVGAYMHRLFRQHAFQGATPREAYYVKCDREINPPTDRELGIVTVEVGFAPLKPAEFVVLRIQQIAEIA